MNNPLIPDTTRKFKHDYKDPMLNFTDKFMMKQDHTQRQKSEDQKPKVWFSLEVPKKKVADIKLDAGLSDLKLPYVPDFGYEQHVTFDLSGDK